MPFAHISLTRDDQRVICASDRNGNVGAWDLETGEKVLLFAGHSWRVSATAVTPDGERAITSSVDKTIKVWCLKTVQCLGTLEGHRTEVRGLSVLSDGARLLSGSLDGSMKLWDIDKGVCLSTFNAQQGRILGVACTPDGRFAVAATRDGVVIWTLPIEPAPKHRSRLYTNAKVILAGDSGVGKSGLAIRLTEDKFEPTVSTDAHWATHLKLPQPDSDSGEKQPGSDPPNLAVKAAMDREIWLWDFARQADYRLIHQLFMDETSLAVLVFNPQSENPFEGIG